MQIVKRLEIGANEMEGRPKVGINSPFETISMISFSFGGGSRGSGDWAQIVCAGAKLAATIRKATRQPGEQRMGASIPFTDDQINDLPAKRAR